MQPAELHVITLWTKSSISQNGNLKRKGEDKQAFFVSTPITWKIKGQMKIFDFYTSPRRGGITLFVFIITCQVLR